VTESPTWATEEETETLGPTERMAPTESIDGSFGSAAVTECGPEDPVGTENEH
jgi:hypothetical protein